MITCSDTCDKIRSIPTTATSLRGGEGPEDEVVEGLVFTLLSIRGERARIASTT